MHVCPECGKSMATAGGLDIHAELIHGAPAAEDEPLSEPAAPPPPAVWPPLPSQDGHPPKVYKPMLRGYDPTLVLTAILVLGLLVAGIGSAVRRSTSSQVSSVSAALQNAAAGGSVTTLPGPTPQTTPATAPRSGAPQSTTPLTQPPLFSQSPSSNSVTPAPSQPTGGCQAVVSSLAYRSSRRTVDAGEMMSAHTFPGLPITGAAPPTIRDEGTLTSPAQLAAADPQDPDAQAIQQLLSKAGFLSMHAIEMTTAGTPSSAAAFKFSSPASALTFDRGLLTVECASGTMENTRPIPGLAGAASFVDRSGDLPYGAAFVAGDTVIVLASCGCAKVPDSQALIGEWAQSVARRLGAA